MLVLKNLMATLAKIGINYAQMTSLLSGFGLDWGSRLRLAFSAMGVAGGAVVQAVSLECVFDFNYASRALVGMIILPLAIALGPGAVLLAEERLRVWWRPRGAAPARRRSVRGRSLGSWPPKCK